MSTRRALLPSPRFSTWFDREGVHVLEKRALPEFFNGSSLHKTPTVRCTAPRPVASGLFDACVCVSVCECECECVCV